MISNVLQFPPFDYSYLFPELVNFHMDRNPSFPIFVYADENVPYALTEISFLEFGRAAHRVAHALRPSRKGADGEIVMIIANTDAILYQAVLVGLIIAGWVPFPVSPRNSVAAVVHMMKKTNCARIMTLDHIHRTLIDNIRTEYEDAHLTIYELPTLHYVFPRLGKEIMADSFTSYPCKRPDLDATAIYLHSSGSTGFPKPIAYSYRLQIQWLAQPLNCLYRDIPAPRRIGAMGAPSFYIFGVVTQLHIPIACLVTTVVYPPQTEKDPFALPVIPTSDNMIDCIKRTGCSVLLTVPAFLEKMIKSQEHVEVLKSLYAVRYGGGPLPIMVGDAICAAGIPLLQEYGASEIGVPVALTQRQDSAEGDWMWVRFADDIKIRWAPQGDGSHELQVLSTEHRRMAIENLPDVNGYATSDLFIKHPTKDLWRIIGRADDVIVLASGEQTVPVLLESIITSSTLVQGAVMFGRGRYQVRVLIEPRAELAIDVGDETAIAEFRNQIWPVVREANKPAPAFSRIFKEMILVARNDKPIPRTAKGTIQRKAALIAYEAEINALYDVVETSLTIPNYLDVPLAWTSELIESWLLNHARSISLGNDVNPHSDLFAQGFDSLSATFLRTRVLGALRASSDPTIQKAATSIPINVVFESPTIQLLSSRIAFLINGKAAGQAIDITAKHKQEINALIEKYSTGLNEHVDGPPPNNPPIEPAVVLVTGTTGRLGSCLFSKLIKHPCVSRIFAINRPTHKTSIEERHASAFRDGGLSLDLLSSDKIVYIEADASLKKCGLPLEQYEEIRNSITTIIHNAWRLDFNLTISSFEEHVRASRNLVDLGRNSFHKQNLRFLFTSSIGSAQNWDNSKGACPEEIQIDPSISAGTGYGESKYVAERVIAKSSLHTTSLRIGQIAGGPGGIWTTTDWFPILVKSSVALGVLPESVDLVSWLRQEDVASVVLETAFAKEPPPPVMNIVNPRSVPWASIISSVRCSIIERKGLPGDVFPIVKFREWFELLESKAEDASEEDLEKIPAIKLLEFFRTLARKDEDSRTEAARGRTSFDTVKAQQVCATMERMQAIGEVEVDAWVGYWALRKAF